MTDWEAHRGDVPGLAATCYLNSCSMGLPDHATLAALHEYGAGWAARGAASWAERWVPALREWREAMARLLGARPEEVAWAPSVGAALGTLGSALLRRRLAGGGRDEVVLGDLEFPAAFAALGQRPGTAVRWAASSGGRIPPARYRELLGARTEALAASRVLYSTGAVQDVRSLCAAARAAGAFSIVDDYQGLGQATLDVAAVGADAVVGGSLKWLCGGVGSAWLHVRRDLVRDLEPMHYGWWANARMFDFGARFEPWQDARRFEGGEVNVAGLLTSLAAARKLLRLGPSRVEARVQALAADLRDRLADAGLPALGLPAAERSAIVAVPRPDAAADAARLARGGIVVDHRGGMVRASPHYYNTEADNQRLVDGLAALAKAAPVGLAASRHG